MEWKEGKKRMEDEKEGRKNGMKCQTDRKEEWTVVDKPRGS